MSGMRLWRTRGECQMLYFLRIRAKFLNNKCQQRINFTSSWLSQVRCVHMMDLLLDSRPLHPARHITPATTSLPDRRITLAEGSMWCPS